MILIFLFIVFTLLLSNSYLANPLNENNKKIAFILPHADDETIGAGGGNIHVNRVRI